jgi:hypothetical protein
MAGFVGYCISIARWRPPVPATLPAQTRRSAIVAALAASLAPAARAEARPQTILPQYTGGPDDWAFLVGSWKVSHRRLKGRLVGSTEWESFAGTCVNWPTMGGAGNVDDNVLELPSGTYRAVGIRAYDARTRQWSIWWLDARVGTIDPPVRGGFKDGVGTFVGDDVHDGKPVKVRFEWSKITPTSGHWEQAFSPDGGRTWEVNWRMEFVRA